MRRGVRERLSTHTLACGMIGDGGAAMGEGAEDVGEAVTGGLMARAVEPQAGEAAGHGSACLNCGTPVTANYCPRCGQAAHVHRTLSAFWHDVAHSVLHFEGKIWRTLPLLAWRPGELTRRYVEGERARFVSPMALFLFSVFLMFATFSLLGGPISTDSSQVVNETTAQERAEARQEFEQERAERIAELNRLRQERARLAAAGQATEEIESAIRAEARALALQKELYDQATALIGEEEAREAEQAEAEEVKSEAGPVKQAAEKAEEENLVVLSGAGSVNQWFNDAYKKAKENPTLLIYKLQTNAYKFSWALIPISVPFVWLLFLHRRRYRQYRVYDHTVFVTYSIAFMSLGLIALTLLKLMGLSETIAILAMILVPPIHMYRQLRGAYRLSRWSAAWRTFVLLIFANVAAGLFFTLLLALGVLG